MYEIKGDEMIYRVCIVEDNQSASEQLRTFLFEYGKSKGCEFSVSDFADPLNFLESFRGNYDIVFMDIELPYLDGMEAVRRIRETDRRVIVIFVTNMAQYAVKGYEVDALDFIVKPVKYSGFAMKLDRAVDRLRMTQDRDIWITEGNNKRRLRISEIKYVEVAHHKVIYHTTGGVYTAYDQLKNVCQSLDGSPFALCNRCFLVNLQYVTAIHEFSVTVGGEELQISRNKKKSFLESLNEFMGGN